MHLDLYVIQFYVVIVFHLVKQSAKPLGFLFIFVNMGPYGSKNFKTLLPHFFIQSEPYSVTNKVAMRERKL